MTTAAPRSGATDPADTYEFGLAGHLDDHWSAWFGARSLVRNDDASTTLTVEVADQAHLHGLLAGMRDVGVTLLSLNLLDGAADESRVSQPVESPTPSLTHTPPRRDDPLVQALRPVFAA